MQWCWELVEPLTSKGQLWEAAGSSGVLSPKGLMLVLWSELATRAGGWLYERSLYLFVSHASCDATKETLPESKEMKPLVLELSVSKAVS